MKANQVLQALFLAGVSLPLHAQPRMHAPPRPPVQAGTLADTDLLYCAQVYAEGGALLRADPDPGVRRTGRDALRRSRVLGASDIDLLNDDPARHKQASLLARQRLAAMPAAPLEARRLALRGAYVECRHLEASAAPAVAPVTTAPAASAGRLPTPPTAAAATGSAQTVPSASRGTTDVLLDDLEPPPTGAEPSTPTPPATHAGTDATPARKGSAMRQLWRALAGGSKAAEGAVLVPAATPVTTPPPVASRAEDASPARTAASALPLPLPQVQVPVPVPVPPQASVPAAMPAPLRPAAATAPQHAGLGDADTLYCEQIYGEVATTAGDGHADAAEAARDARERWRPLNERGYDLLNESPARHSRATTAARLRLAALPEAPGRARTMALRAAYEECRGLEDRTTATPTAAAPDRVRMLANRRFCRDLMLSKLKVSPKLRAAFSPGEIAALDEIQKISAALAQPLPGSPLTQAQDREATQLQAQLRDTLDLAVANRSDAKDPVVLALGQCHEDYVQGLLGGPDVLATAGADDTMHNAAADAVAKAPEVRMADLGPVFHVREVTPAGNFDAIWIRRGQGNLYDGVWVQAGNGQLQRDVLELRGIIDGELTVYRQSYRGSYRARVRADGTLAPGAASWFEGAAYAWGPLPPQSLRADPGAVLHMREVTPYGNYEGLWRQRGTTGVYDVAWVFLPTGELTADVLAVTGMARGQLIIRRVNGPGLFPLKRRADSMAYKDPATGARVMPRWEVVPAQPVRIGKTPR